MIIFMEIMSRKEAISRGVDKYFTGMPCKNNHLTYRYTQSGTCALCVRAGTGSVEYLQQRQEIAERRRITVQRLQSMIQFRARVFTKDLGFFAAIVHAAAMQHELGCTLHDVWTGGEGKLRAADSAVHSFNCFAEDLESLRETANNLFNAGCASPTETESRRLAALKAIENEASSASGVPSGDPA